MQTSHHEPARDLRVAARADVVVVGGGPAGFAAAVAARGRARRCAWSNATRTSAGWRPAAWCWCWTTCAPGAEITVRGICAELVERMRGRGLAMYPPEHERGHDPAMFRKWSRWGLFDFNTRTKPHPICYAVAFDPDGWKRASDDMVQEAGDRAAPAQPVRRQHRPGRPGRRRDRGKQGRARGGHGRRGDRHHRRPRRGGLGGRRVLPRLLHGDHGVPPRRRGHRRGRAVPVRGAGAPRGAGPRGASRDRRLVGLLVAEDAAARHRLVQLPAHDGTGRDEGGGPHPRGVRGAPAHPRDGGARARETARASPSATWWTWRRRPACGRRACWKASTS